MALSISELRAKRNEHAKNMKALLDENPGEKWTPAHTEKYDAMVNEIGEIDAAIKRHQQVLDLTAEEIETEAVSNAVDRHLHNKGGGKSDPAVAIFDKWLRRGDSALSAEDWAVVRNTMSTTAPGQGGYTVPSLIASQLIDAMKAYGTMRAVADSITTADGRPLSYPTSDGTAEVGEWIDQNTTATGSDPSFNTVSLNVFKASSKVVAVPFELLQDTTIDMEAFVRNRLAQRLGRLLNLAFTVGTGTTQPDGVVPKASAGKVGTTGQTLTIIYDDLVDLVHSVDPAYRGPGSAFMTSDSLLKVLRKLKDTAGRPLWMPSYDAGITAAANPAGHGGLASQNTPVIFDYLMGYPVWVNNDMAVPAANAKSLLFGNYSYYKIRDAMDVTMFRFTDSAYTKLGQVGFLAWARAGGNLVDTNAVKYYQHSAT